MNAILLILSILGVTVQQVTRKAFDLKTKNGAFTFTVLSAFFAMIVFVLFAGGKFDFSADFIGYSISFAVAYSLSLSFTFLAIKTGSLAMTSLVVQYSLIIPTFYGLFVLGEQVKNTLYIGIVFLIVSLFLINIKGKADLIVTKKWGVYAIISFIGNGLCSTIQKAQQIKFDGMYKSEFMITSLLLSVILISAVVFLKEKEDFLINVKKGALLYTICGLANGGVNLIIIFLALRMSASLMFPVVAAGGIITTTAVSVFGYKEKMSVFQWVGLFLGIVSIVLLNI